MRYWKNKVKALLTTSASSDSEYDSKNAFREILKEAGFELVETFSTKGTQAFMCLRRIKPRFDEKEKVMAFLVFRGTEPTDFADIKTDIKVKLTDVDVGGDMTIQMHSGYVEAFNLVCKDVEAILDETPHD